MADTSKGGLLLGRGIHPVFLFHLPEYNTSQLHRCLRAEVNKFLLAYVLLLNTFIFGNISPACAKEYLTAATYYCQVEVKVRNRIAVVISEIIVGSTGRHFSARFLW